MSPYRNSAKEYQEKKTFFQELFEKIMKLPCEKFEKYYGRSRYIYSIANEKIGIISCGFFERKLRIVEIKRIFKYNDDDAIDFRYTTYYKITGKSKIKLLEKLQEVEAFYIRKEKEKAKKEKEKENDILSSLE